VRSDVEYGVFLFIKCRVFERRMWCVQVENVVHSGVEYGVFGSRMWCIQM